MRIRVTSSRVNSVLIVPPTSADPRLGIEIGAFFSFGIRKQEAPSPGGIHMSARRTARDPNFFPWARWWASVRSMLSPPRRMWSPDGHTCELQIAVLFGYSDQGKVGRAAADIDHKDHVSDFDLLSGMRHPPFRSRHKAPPVVLRAASRS